MSVGMLKFVCAVQRLLSIYVQSLSTLCFGDQHLLVILELTSSARLDSVLQGILLSAPPQHLNCRYKLEEFTCMLSIQTHDCATVCS